MKVSSGGQYYALFIQEEAPSLYRGLPQQLFTVFLGFLLLFIILLLIGRPWRHRDGARVYINAIRRMSKGDFSVSIAKSEQIPQFGELAASINDMAAELSQLEQMRQTFISNVSHEIQSPLTSIRGFAKALQHEGIDDEQRNHYASIIENESTRLSKLSDNLLKLTTLEARDEPIRLKPLRLDQQVRSMILACEPLWMDKNINMDVNLDEEVTIYGDDELLSQVWMNILANSMKFTPEGGTVSVEVKQTAGGASVSITDTGIGISEGDLPHIFERFFKADKSRNGKLGGSGLGLSIVKRIVDMHNGTVTANSKADEGTTITVLLPSGPPPIQPPPQPQPKQK
ncbi:HAMP domain-containing sensor histidine kinase [Paenibacillus albus]|uniref:histidine kinase n=2 Tax=Paenibacillus albus TaxID=2495582 RepID=A0A3Q8XC79_9BACL|nr:HAMP domain-containing sensor histidine kinase [Paenibacillus albus]